jgi:hypothetical protein
MAKPACRKRRHVVQDATEAPCRFQHVVKIPMPTPSRKITELDALRGLAALVVFTGHFFEGMIPARYPRSGGRDVSAGPGTAQPCSFDDALGTSRQFPGRRTGIRNPVIFVEDCTSRLVGPYRPRRGCLPSVACAISVGRRGSSASSEGRPSNPTAGFSCRHDDRRRCGALVLGKSHGISVPVLARDLVPLVSHASAGDAVVHLAGLHSVAAEPPERFNPPLNGWMHAAPGSRGPCAVMPDANRIVYRRGPTSPRPKARPRGNTGGGDVPTRSRSGPCCLPYGSGDFK